jgi:hypothetical protein
MIDELGLKAAWKTGEATFFSHSAVLGSAALSPSSDSGMELVRDEDSVENSESDIEPPTSTSPSFPQLRHCAESAASLRRKISVGSHQSFVQPSEMGSSTHTSLLSATTSLPLRESAAIATRSCLKGMACTSFVGDERMFS